MLGLRRTFATFVIVSISGVLVASPARAQSTYVIEVGAPLDAPAPAESLRFFPATIQVHEGDVLRFRSLLAHNVTLLPAGYDIDAFLDQQWRGTDGEWSPFINDADEGARALKINPRIVFPTFPHCGEPFEQDPCPYDADPGLGPVSAGTSIPAASAYLDRSFQVTAPAGTTFTAVDLLFPNLRMTVEVVPGTEPASDPQAIASTTTSQITADTAQARSLHSANVNKKPFKGRGAKRVWTVKAGIAKDRVSLHAFYPSKLTIAPKQRVKWTFKQLLWSTASVTFPSSRGEEIAGRFPDLGCDVDGAGTGADEEPVYTTAPYCDDPLQLELDVPADIVAVAGDGKVTSVTDFEHSGIRGAGYAQRNDPYTLRFPKRSGKKGFSYTSIGGLLMPGKVIVK